MPEGTSDALLGLGMPAQLAAVLGGNPSILVCAGTTQTTAAVVKTKNVELTAAGGATGAIPPSIFPVMENIKLYNSSGTTAVIYVPVGHTLAGTLNGSLNLATTKACEIYQYKPKFWAYNLSA